MGFFTMDCTRWTAEHNTDVRETSADVRETLCLFSNGIMSQ